MKICANNHIRLAFAGQECPLCDANKEIADLKFELNVRDNQVYDLEKELDNVGG